MDIDIRDVWAVETLTDRSGEPLVRLFILERDAETGARSVKDIIEYSLEAWTPAQVGRMMVQMRGPEDESEVELHLPDGFTMPPRARRLATRLTKIIEYKVQKGAN